MTFRLGFDPETPASTKRVVLVVLALAVLGISSSAVIVRSMVAPALAIAAWRTLGASLLLAVPGRAGLVDVGRREVLGIAVAGATLGLHFWAWFASVQQTTVLRSTLLVCLVPAWTALLEWGLFGVRPRAAHWLGIAVALPGLGLLAGDPAGTASGTGDGLAVFAGVLWAIYLLVGRRVRQRVSIHTYMGLVCAAAAALLFPAAWATGTPLGGWPLSTWALLGAAIAGPQLLGHQGFNYAVKWLPATTISSIMLLEPVGATLLGIVVLGELPGPMAAVGGLVVLVGITVATRPPSDQSTDSQAVARSSADGSPGSDASS
ncbi:MAG: DMT family transporter [Myxococcales bacterium]|nr:DMT family transporter [Myxococcales bacterium]